MITNLTALAIGGVFGWIAAEGIWRLLKWRRACQVRRLMQDHQRRDAPLAPFSYPVDDERRRRLKALAAADHAIAQKRRSEWPS